MTQSGSDAKPPAKGTPEPKQRRFRIGPMWIAATLILLTLNFWVGQRATQAPERVRVPYSPYFIDRGESGQVGQITSKGTAIQGTFN